MSTMTVDAPDGTKTYTSNGKPKDRAAVKAEFDALMSSGSYLAYAVEAPGKATAIREFDPEAQEIVLTPQLAGG